MSMKEIIYELTDHNRKQSKIKTLISIFLKTSKSAVFTYRVATLMKNRGHRIISYLMLRRLEKSYGLFIGPNAQIASGIKFPHVTSIVIGDGVVIGKNVTIYQQVTLGKRNLEDSRIGSYPTIGDNVIIYAGAKIIGNVVVGDGAIIGANSVVVSDVEPNAIYAGIPAKRIDKRVK